MLEELGFILYCENIWFKYSEKNNIRIPSFILTRLVNPNQNKFVVKNLLIENDEIVTDNYKELIEFVKSNERNKKIDDIIN